PPIPATLPALLRLLSPSRTTTSPRRTQPVLQKPPSWHRMRARPSLRRAGPPEDTMKRRDFVSRLGLGSQALITPALGTAAPVRVQGQAGSNEHAHGGNDPIHGPQANAVV